MTTMTEVQLQAGEHTHTATVTGLTADPSTAAAVCQCGLTAVSTPVRVVAMLRRKHRTAGR